MPLTKTHTTETGEYLFLESVTKVWNTNRTMKAISNVTLNIEQKSIVSIIGKSGVGKTTLLKIMSGLILPTTGRVLLNSSEIKGPTRSVSMVFQDYGRSLLPWRNVIENVMLPLEGLRLTRKEQLLLAEKSLHIVGLGNEAHFRIRELSGGMQQRVAIARCIAQGAKVLLLDEPFSALDTVTKYQLQQELLNMWQTQNLTVVIVCHDVEDAIFLSDCVVILDKTSPSISDLFHVNLPWPRQHLPTMANPEFNLLRERILSGLFRLKGDDDEYVDK